MFDAAQLAGGAAVSRIVEPIMGAQIDALSWHTCTNRILAWARAGTPSYVCVCNTHSVVTARDDRLFRDAVKNADMAIPDGMPLVWVLKLRGRASQDRVNGPDLMLRLLAQCEREGLGVYFYGSSAETLALLEERLRQEFPRLRIAGSVSPPYRDLDEAEQAALLRRIATSGARLVFVALGCPKQEKWMARHHDQVPAVMLGVGAAFDYHAGTVRRPPPIMQRLGLEWLGRLLAEPRRLWRRYMFTNPLMCLYLARELVRSARRRAAPGRLSP